MSAQPRVDLSLFLEEEFEQNTPELIIEHENIRPPPTDEPPKKKRKVDLRGYHWFLTWNNPPEGSEDVLAEIAEQCKAYAYQKEMVSVLHWQGCFSFKNQKRWSELDNKLSPKGVWAKCRNVFAARNYCRKKVSRVGNCFSKGYCFGEQEVKDPLDGKVLYAFQKEILKLIEEVPDERSIHWYWSLKGNIGKTSLCKHLCLKHGALIVGGKYRDAYYSIAERKAAKLPVDLIVFNIPRNQGNKVSYTSIEGIKDGMFNSTKYKSCMVVYNCPHVIIFANSPPDLSMLSEDRWKIRALDDDADLVLI